MCKFCAAIPMLASIGAAIIGKQKEKQLEEQSCAISHLKVACQLA